LIPIPHRNVGYFLAIRFVCQFFTQYHLAQKKSGFKMVHIPIQTDDNSMP
tara:strand:- start:24464 stop:24613 length:150 start_codon:yes stop_codon:yes gene_type:complete